MIETRVRVLSSLDGISLVEATEANGCAACASRAACGISGLGRAFGRHRRRAVALSCGKVRPGQELTVSISEADLLKIGLWAYLLPTTLAVAGAATLAGWGDAAAALGALLGFGAGLLTARRYAVAPPLSITQGEPS